MSDLRLSNESETFSFSAPRSKRNALAYSSVQWSVTPNKEQLQTVGQVLESEAYLQEEFDRQEIDHFEIWDLIAMKFSHFG